MGGGGGLENAMIIYSFITGQVTQNLYVLLSREKNTVELQWLEHLWNNEIMIETGVVRANELIAQCQEA